MVQTRRVSRRRFLVGTLAGVSQAFVLSRAFAAESKPLDPNRVALLSDTHIAGDRTLQAHGINMADHLTQVVNEILECDPLPASAFICGDCAFREGQEKDYVTLAQILKPLQKAGIHVYAVPGNHDHREHFRHVFENEFPDPLPVENRLVKIVEGTHANWFLLDSLDKVNKTPGLLGEKQRAWLEQALNRHSDKPALVMCHHNPDPRPKSSGLIDTLELQKLLQEHSHVKTWLFGHSHVFGFLPIGHVLLLNLPATAYVFSKTQPSAWTDARLRADGLSLTLRCLDKKHPLHNKHFELDWK